MFCRLLWRRTAERVNKTEDAPPSTQERGSTVFLRARAPAHATSLPAGPPYCCLTSSPTAAKYMRILVCALFPPSLRVVARCRWCHSSHRVRMRSQLNRLHYLNRRSTSGYSCIRVRNKSAWRRLPGHSFPAGPFASSSRRVCARPVCKSETCFFGLFAHSLLGLVAILRVLLRSWRMSRATDLVAPRVGVLGRLVGVPPSHQMYA